MDSVFVLVYCNSDIISSYEGIKFECHSGPKVITISEDMSLDALRKIIFYANGGCRILLNLFYHQQIHVGDGCVEYDYVELKHNDDVGKMLFGSLSKEKNQQSLRKLVCLLSNYATYSKYFI
ncbi:hypothetical protein GmHk_17G049594 [Glycine max]|nr:hypothetical protein GmHk_17G049594 [Glycine max]